MPDTINLSRQESQQNTFSMFGRCGARMLRKKLLLKCTEYNSDLNTIIFKRYLFVYTLTKKKKVE